MIHDFYIQVRGIPGLSADEAMAEVKNQLSHCTMFKVVSVTETLKKPKKPKKKKKEWTLWTFGQHTHNQHTHKR